MLGIVAANSHDLAGLNRWQEYHVGQTVALAPGSRLAVDRHGDLLARFSLDADQGYLFAEADASDTHVDILAEAPGPGDIGPVRPAASSSPRGPARRAGPRGWS